MPSDAASVPLEETGILLIAHGSRKPEANADLVALAEQLRQQKPYACVEVSYLELAEPNIPTGGARCASQNVKQVRLMPYFLSPGVHVCNDLEHERKDLAARFPHVEFVLCPPLGRHPGMLQVVLDRLQETYTE